jgi:ornithine cyclodeaminase
MRTFNLAEIRAALVDTEIIDRMREALAAQARGECDTPMPMHLDIAPEAGEVHIKSSYRRGGKYFALKVASTFPGNAARGLSTGNGMMVLCSAETGEPLALLADEGHLTDVRTAAAGALAARALERDDHAIGILGTGIQARLQARLHAAVLPLREIWIWGRTPERALQCRDDLRALLPGVDVTLAESAAALAAHAKLLITTTASRAPLLRHRDLQPGTHITAVGSDSPGKQELDPKIVRRAGLVLVDSVRQCEKLGELQHCPEQTQRAVELGAYCESPRRRPPLENTVCDLTGLGVEDLYIAEYCYENRKI